MADGDRYLFCRYEGEDVSFVVPAWEGGKRVEGIAPKAFLSCKTVRRLEIPDGVGYIGDWAFAHMKNLEELVLPFSRIEYGRKVFLGCPRLRKVSVRGSAVGNEGLPYFLASVASVMGKESLWRPECAADVGLHAGWMGEYDRALEEYLDVPDEDGFEPVFIGWFHIEDMDEQIPRYVEKRRKEKIRLVLQRLRYPMYLAEDGKRRLQGYLARERNGGDGVLEAVVCDREWEYCNQVCYLKILKGSGCLDRGNIPVLMEGLKGANPEMTAYLLQCMDEGRTQDGFFAGLEL